MKDEGRGKSVKQNLLHGRRELFICFGLGELGERGVLHFGDLLHIFVTATREVNENDFVRVHRGGDTNGMGDSVSSFERGDNAFGSRKFVEGGESLVVRGVDVVGATLVTQVAMLGANGGVIQTGGDGVGKLDLAVFVREEEGLGALQDTEASALETGRVLLADAHAFATRLDANHADGFVIKERVEEADGIAAAAHAGDEQMGEATFAGEHLTAGLVADDTVEVAHHHRVGMRAECAAKNVESGTDIGDPVSHRLVDGFLERGGSGGDGNHLRAEETHPSNVEGLAGHIHLAHIDDALQAEMRGGGSRSDAVLACAGFCNDALFTHAAGEEDLTEGVVDLVRAGVQKVLTFEVNFRAAELFGEAFGEVERGRTTGKISEEGGEFGLELRVAAGTVVFVRQVAQRGHERLGHEHAAVRTEIAVRVGKRLHESGRAREKQLKGEAGTSKYGWGVPSWLL